MDTINEKIDKIWEMVYEENPDLMYDWIQCFSSSNSYREGKEKSKQEIKMTLSRSEYQTDPEKNFLYRLMSRESQKYGYVDPNGERKRRGDLAMLFIQVMMENSYCKDFVVTTLALHNAPVAHCLETTTDKTTPLHNAARFEDVAEVKRLIGEGGQMATNRYGYTPLHFAAMAINPKPEIAKLLIHAVGTNERIQLLNEQTNDKCGRNTALHIAAANVKVTQEFIQHFKDANPLLRDCKNDTPFHAAAKSSNPQAIVYMLNTFSPTNSSWDIDDVEGQVKDENTLVKICARAGNAEAVELLIKHGTDISQGVLHEIVIESVKNPKKIDDLVRVYQSVVDNAVTWRNLEEELGFIKGSDEYAERFRKTMMWLLTTPNEKYEGEDVLQCALTHGAFAMFWQIINTKSVFRMDGKEAHEFVEKENANGVVTKSTGDAKRCQKNWTVFDVTNLTSETMHANPRAFRPVASSSETAPLKSSHPQDQHSVNGSRFAELNEVQAEPRSERNFDSVPPRTTSYLTHLLAVFDQWKSSNILSIQPFKEIAKPYIGLAQRFYFIIGLLQLVFMITFSVYWMPTTCSLAMMFNISTTGCSSNSTVDAILSSFSFSQQRSWIAMLWLIWPLFLFAGNMFISFQYGRYAYFSHKQFSNEIVFKPYKAILQNLLLRVFCILVFAWLYVFYRSESHESYAKVTALVVLFGWMTNMSFFGYMSKTFGISALVVKEIIVKDIPSFMLFFAFNVVGFSFAIHIIRTSACMSPQISYMYLHDTVFAVLASTFGIGDFIDSTITDPVCQGGGMQTLFDFVYFGYLLATIIILLNLLIAMMNNRYEEAKRKAENVWMFQTLSLMRALESHWYLRKVKKNFNIIDLWRPANSSKKSLGCYFGCCYSNENRGSITYNKKLKRYYLRLLLQEDEQCLEKL